MPDPIAPPPLPLPPKREEDEETRLRKAARRLKDEGRKGREQTILTGGSGLPDLPVLSRKPIL